MTVSAAQTLVAFLAIFGIVGSVRGPAREVWTLGGVTLTVVLLSFGGATFFEQLPVHFGAAFMSLIGDQASSADIAAHPWQSPGTVVMLLVATVALVTLAYLMGQAFGKEQPTTFGERVAGFVMGAINGVFIALFLFNQKDLQPGLNIQFPSGLLTRSSVVPLVLVGVIIAIIAITNRRQAKPASK